MAKVDPNGYEAVRFDAGRPPRPANDGGRTRQPRRDVVSADEHQQPGPAWVARCQIGENGDLIPNFANAMVAMREAPEFVDAFALDDMLQQVLVLRPMPGTVEIGGTFKPRALEDTDVSAAQEVIQLAGISRMSRDATHQAVEARAKQRRFHPVRQYLEGLKWDGTERVHSWLATYLGAENVTYTSSIGTMFLVAMVARIFEPGCKMDYMLVLEGRQGKKKSTACRVLAGEWFSDNLPDLGTGKDVAGHLRGKWLIEISELSAVSKSDESALKSFISRQVEKYRPPYGKCEINQPRMCVFIGTTNKKAYLRDETGGRRIWPVKTGRIDIEALKPDRDQLFAEAMALFASGAQSWPDADFEAEHIKPEQEGRYETDAWEQPVAKWLAGEHDVTIGEVAVGSLMMESQRIDRTTQLRLTAIMERLGWASTGKSTGGRRPWKRLEAED